MSLPAVPEPASAPTAALAAAQRIHGLYAAVRAVAAQAEAMVMEALWDIRREIPDRHAFEEFVIEHTPLSDGRQAWLQAETWETARRSRHMRELASDRPQEAMRMVQGFLDAAAEDGLEMLGEDDVQVAAIYAMPPRKRARAIRDLVESRRTVDSGRSPDDVERIAALTAERDEAVARLNAPTPETKEVLAELGAVESRLAEVAGRVAVLFVDGEPVPELARRRVLRWGDQLHETVDQILDAASRPGD